MARGKEALASANARHRAALDHIDRLTEQIGELKARVKVVEHDASQARALREQVRGLEDVLLHDDLLEEVLHRGIAWYLSYRELDQLFEDKFKAWRQGFHDVLNDVVAMTGMTPIEAIEYTHRRIPDDMRVETAEEIARPFRRPTERRPDLSDRQVVRLQKAAGKRHVGYDPVELWRDLAESKEAGFSEDEIRDYMEDHFHLVRQAMSESRQRRIKERQEKEPNV